MTREEAIRLLDPKTYPDAIAEIEYHAGFSGEMAKALAIAEACQMAVAALRAQQTPVQIDRRRWEGCGYCSDPEDVESFDFEYCPYCGKPITEETWAETELRIGGKDETNNTPRFQW